MDPKKFDAEPGDLIEIDRWMYQHWAIYIGGEEVVNFAPPNGDIALEHPKGQVKREKIWEVVGNDKFKINNLLDDKYQPRERDIIVKDAVRMVAEAAKTADRLLGVGISFLDALNDFFHKDANKEERR
ncbi:phospholipase A and acyltransferase 4-like isoform X2 [Perca fluviatilis]|uniref:phospholipase A and acyltransferase 4-like isoform X2 n=1 Tax=Perca fluviatilis TaxID=8168 RepID=UPI001962C2BE|nr:phospholipase A and acyltransferase 4-like isoform X2 [Perca fluviatilis]